MKALSWLLVVVTVIFVHSAAFGDGQFLKVFDDTKGIIEDLTGVNQDVWVIPYGLHGMGFGWAEESGADGAILMMAQDMDSFDYQYAHIDFYIPNGIGDHILLAVQTTLVENPIGASGYFAVLFGDGILSIEKDQYDPIPWNWLHSSIQVPIDTVHVQRLAIETTKYADHMHIVADVLAYDEDEILWDVETSYDDYNGQGYNYQARDGSDGNYFTGVRALFAVIGPSNPIYVQNFYVEWR